MKIIRQALDIGDVIKTNPLKNFWACSIVLHVGKKGTKYKNSCLIGITNLVFNHDYTIEDIIRQKLHILKHNINVRVTPHHYIFNRKVPLIGIFPRKISKDVDIVGTINTSDIRVPKLLFEIGNGADGGWPLYDRVDQSLGFEAIHSWRSKHDRINWKKEIETAKKSHENMLVKIHNFKSEE